jgi:acetamidase/formamidase
VSIRRITLFPLALNMLLRVACVDAVQAQSTFDLKCAPGNVQWGHSEAGAKPVLRIASGDSVKVETCSGAEPGPDLPASEIPPQWAAVQESITDHGPGVHLLTGPIYVESAEPGDVLEIRFQKFEYAVPFAIVAILPGFSALFDDFPYDYFRTVHLNRRTETAEFRPGITLKLRPFFGFVGVAPPESMGHVSSNPPNFYGGNLDNRELTAGSTLYLPVQVPGALLSVGDAHAVQGDGEVSCCALETALIGTMQISVRKGQRLLWPRAETPTHYITMGLNADLNQAAQLATRQMLDWLVTEKRLSREDAFTLCSVAMELRITQVVDGTKGVHAMMPKSVFTK